MKSRKLSMIFMSFFVFGVALLQAVSGAFGNYNSDKVLLSDVHAITLHQGQMTNARRSSPIPQLKCVGGTAQYKFTPAVVQCINQGSDGTDIQWECKADMDNAYRFGHVEVSCEGYDYPNDPFVLKGSCGLEYTIDFTEEGFRNERKKGGNQYGTSYHQTKSEGGVGGLFVFAGVLFAIYVIWKTCIAPNAQAQAHQNQSGTGRADPSAPPQPPPYGFRPEFMPNQDAPPPYESCGTSGSHHSQSSERRSQDGPGFWTGAATGGFLGYMFGQGNNNRWGSGWNSGGWGSQHHNHRHSAPSGGFFSSSPSSSSGPSSSGTRTASGFGKTSRR